MGGLAQIGNPNLGIAPPPMTPSMGAEIQQQQQQLHQQQQGQYQQQMIPGAPPPMPPPQQMQQQYYQQQMPDISDMSLNQRPPPEPQDPSKEAANIFAKSRTAASSNFSTVSGEAQVAPPTSVFLNSRKTQLTYGKPNAGIQVAKSAGRGAALTDKYGNLI